MVGSLVSMIGLSWVLSGRLWTQGHMSFSKHGCSKLYFLFDKEGQMIISLPESCLLTTDTVIRSYLGAYIAK